MHQPVYIGVVFDREMTLVEHVTTICKICFLQLRNIAKIRDSLSQKDTEILVHEFISSKLDSCNSLLYGLPQSLIDCLQAVQNCATLLVTRSRKHDHIMPILKQLHWLPMYSCIKYKISKALPSAILKKYGCRSFSFSAPTIWNSLSEPIRNHDEISKFKTSVKTFLFKKHFVRVLLE